LLLPQKLSRPGLAKVCWFSNPGIGALQNIKFQAPKLRVSGFRCQGKKAETLPLKPETLVNEQVAL
jgi:hypothetical protein